MGGQAGVFRIPSCEQQKMVCSFYDRKGFAARSAAEEVPVLNLKADPRLIGPQREKPGFFPAYHMNKEHWITAALDGSAPEDEIKILLAMSYDLTAMTRAFRKNTILP